MSYHLSVIPRGQLGEISKVVEEALEAQDAQQQGVDIMVLVELSDLYGAIEAYLEQHHPQLTMNDLKLMSDVTKRAFQSGHR